MLYFIIGAIFSVIYLSLIIISDIVYGNEKKFTVYVFASVFFGLIWIAIVFVTVLFFIGWLIFRIVEIIKNKKGKE